MVYIIACIVPYVDTHNMWQTKQKSTVIFHDWQ